MERAMGFEPTTSCLGSKHSTPELRPLDVCDYTIIEPRYPCILMGGAEPRSRGMRFPVFFPDIGQEISQIPSVQSRLNIKF